MQIVLFDGIIGLAYDLSWKNCRRITPLLDLNNLRFFYHVAKNLSFTLAANDLCVTQPSVTQRIKVLEESCKLKLFGKSRGKTYLTEEGKTLYDSVKKIFDYEKEVESTINNLRELKQGVLRLGLPSTALSAALSVLMDRFHKEFPDIKMQITTGNSHEIVKSLLNHEIEIGNIAKVDEHPDIEYLSMYPEKIALIANPLHRFAKKTTVSLKELAAESIVLREKGSGTRRTVLEMFEENHMTPNILLETTNPEYIKKLVQQGNGVAFLSARTVQQEIEKGELITVPIKDNELSINLCAAYLKNKPLSRAAKAYLKIIKKNNP